MPYTQCLDSTINIFTVLSHTSTPLPTVYPTPSPPRVFSGDPYPALLKMSAALWTQL